MKLFLIVCAFLVCVPTVAATNPKHHVPPPVVAPPVGHDCTYTGAGKDGAPGNDDCAPLPTPPTTTTTPPVRTVVVTPPPTVITITNTVTAKPKTVIKWRTKVKTVVRVKRVMVACPKNTKPHKGKCVQTGKTLTG